MVYKYLFKRDVTAGGIAGLNQTTSDYDSPWKEALDLYFEPFMAFFFSKAYDDIDWSKGYESLDKELPEIVRDAETGRRFADKLVKVWLRSGEEAFLFIHVEIVRRESRVSEARASPMTEARVLPGNPLSQFPRNGVKYPAYASSQ